MVLFGVAVHKARIQWFASVFSKSGVGGFFPTGQQYKYSHPRKSWSLVRLEGWLAGRHPEEGSDVPHWHCLSHPKDRTMAIKQIQAPSLSFICLVYKLAPRQK